MENTEKLTAAQNDLDRLLDNYYSRQNDGGCHDEIFIIALRVAKRHDVDVNELAF